MAPVYELTSDCSEYRVHTSPALSLSLSSHFPRLQFLSVSRCTEKLSLRIHLEYVTYAQGITDLMRLHLWDGHTLCDITLTEHLMCNIRHSPPLRSLHLCTTSSTLAGSLCLLGCHIHPKSPKCILSHSLPLSLPVFPSHCAHCTSSLVLCASSVRVTREKKSTVMRAP